jgi:hypothetical protein
MIDELLEVITFMKSVDGEVDKLWHELWRGLSGRS